MIVVHGIALSLVFGSLINPSGRRRTRVRFGLSFVSTASPTDPDHLFRQDDVYESNLWVPMEIHNILTLCSPL